MRDVLVARGIAVHQVGEVYEVDSDGVALTEEVKGKWCVSVPAASSLAAAVQEIPLADSEDQAWEHARQHFGAGVGDSSPTSIDSKGDFA